MSINAAALRAFVLQQMVAESYLEDVWQGISNERNNRLRLGFNHYQYFRDPAEADLDSATRMTDSQIRDFNGRFQILAHQVNTWTGFSGTLFFDTETGTYTLSFRSLEFASIFVGG